MNARAMRRPPPRPDRGEAGFATVLGALAICAIVALVIALTEIVGAISTRHRAESAADLGALAGAAWVLTDPDYGCAQARRVVAENGGTLTSCAADGVDILVRVTIPIRSNLLPGRSARAAARAGPLIAE